MTLLKQYEPLFAHNPELRNVLALIYYDILEFNKGALRFFSGRGKVLCRYLYNTYH